jgi:hypothetical protein
MSPRRAHPGSIALLALLVVGRLAVHSFFLPAFEGPDEPFHLGRIVAFREVPFSRAFRGVPLSPAIVAAVAVHPCCPDLRRAFSCPPFDGGGAAFNVLDGRTFPPASFVVENYENHQPPLYYVVAGSAHRWMTSSPDSTASRVGLVLLLFRLWSVTLVALALFWPLRVVSREWPGPSAAFLLLLLLPGAADALARCSNDAALFLWSSLVVLALTERVRGGVLLLLLALGPLIKLTAFPVTAMALVWLWRHRRRRVAVAAGLASLIVVPIQLLRGWQWGGTYELNRTALDLAGSLFEVARGLMRSLYTMIKTVFWVGGWSFFRAPGSLVVAWFLLLGIVLLSLRVRDRRTWIPHAAGGVTVVIGALLMAVGNRTLFGDWGGLGGWYFWGWFPAICFAGAEAFEIPAKSGRWLLAAGATFALWANVAYFLAAWKLYG